MSRPTAKELLDTIDEHFKGWPPSHMAPVDLAARVEKVLEMPHPEPGGLPIAIAGWNACYASVLCLLNGEEP